jgi:hypothetical protein
MDLPGLRPRVPLASLYFDLRVARASILSSLA